MENPVKRGRRKISSAFVIAAGVLIIGLLVGNIAFTDGDEDEENAGAQVEEDTESTTTTEKDEGLSDEEIDEIVRRTFEGMGFNPDEVLVDDEVDFEGAPQERGGASFSDVTLESREDVANFLNGDSPESLAARARVEAALADKPGELERALSGEGYVPVQFTVAVQYFGTTYFNGSDVIVAGDPRQTEPDDILWLFITKEGIIVSKASIRADCANPEFELIIPKRPETPPAPPIDTPPCLRDCEPPPPPPPPPPVCPPDKPHGEWPICKDGPDREISNNDDVPAPPKGPGCPHQEYAGGPCVPSPGPQTPVDSPTGCNGPCEEDDGFPPTTTTTAPQPPSTPTPTVPSCGQQGQPSCGNTGVTPPTTTAPPADPVPDDPSNEGTIPTP